MCMFARGTAAERAAIGAKRHTRAAQPIGQCLVREGDHITRGELIGRMGSTGRSTGNHLHYEVRIDGRAVNPIPFMKSTDYVLAMQRRAGAASMDAVAVGGPSGGK